MSKVGREHALDLTVGNEHAGLRLDQFLAVALPRLSRTRLQRLIRDGHVRLAGRQPKPSLEVRAGDVVAVDEPAAVRPALIPEPVPLDIVYEDTDLLVVNKPPGMVVHPAAGHTAGTLVHALVHHVRDLSGLGGEGRPGIVHRLDRGTSGLMVVAKHDAAHLSLARQFRDREVDKRYVALVWGVVHSGRRMDAAIGRDPSRRQRMSTRGRRAREAVTRVTAARHLRGVSLLDVAIATGRTHQIRVHLSAIGHPVVGDALYGGVRRRLPAHLRALGRLERPFLHAARLAFAHPRDGRRFEFNSPLPADLQAVLDDLETGIHGHVAPRPEST
jgi:23S rRNA pseudouridine1911/1915/1917 synthase